MLCLLLSGQIRIDLGKLLLQLRSMLGKPLEILLVWRLVTPPLSNPVFFQHQFE